MRRARARQPRTRTHQPPRPRATASDSTETTRSGIEPQPGPEIASGSSTGSPTGLHALQVTGGWIPGRISGASNGDKPREPAASAAVTSRATGSLEPSTIRWRPDASHSVAVNLSAARNCKAGGFAVAALHRGRPSRHQRRWVAVARCLFSPDSAVGPRFLGCTADAHDVALSVGGDDIALRRAIAPVLGGRPREFLGGVLPVVGAGLPVARRAVLVTSMVTRGKARARAGVDGPHIPPRGRRSSAWSRPRRPSYSISRPRWRSSPTSPTSNRRTSPATHAPSRHWQQRPIRTRPNCSTEPAWRRTWAGSPCRAGSGRGPNRCRRRTSRRSGCTPTTPSGSWRGQQQPRRWPASPASTTNASMARATTAAPPPPRSPIPLAPWTLNRPRAGGGHGGCPGIRGVMPAPKKYQVELRDRSIPLV